MTAMARNLPSGTVTFLFTDVEGSTKLLHELGAAAYADALLEHRRLVRAACAAEGGVEVDTQGDAFFFAFPDAPGALAAASEFTEALASGPIQVRVGLHTGSPLQTTEGYVGEDVHLAARVAATSHGGQVVLSKATAALVQAELTDLGEHRLNDVAEPVAIYQLGTGSFPPLKTISNTNLPRPASSFVGREQELQEVLGRIERGARLVTLTGPGGSGKTRLALEAAASLVPEYKAGVFWVGLAALRDPALVTETISQTLGANDGLAEHIGEREMLLLLDNLEQVVEAAPELASLLEACNNVVLLVTSRELLGVRGEVEYPVPPLASPEAVALFCERSGLEASGEIAELCARLDNLPLAVELSAARTKALTVAQILERLSQRLDLLRGGRDADPRQQTLRATIEWSYDLLPPDEQRLFAALSVFAGGCTLEAAEEVADADLDTLQSLVQKSLLRFTNGRYWMLETVREYAGEQLSRDGETDLRRQAHLDYFVHLAEGAEHALWARQHSVATRFDLEEANFRVALASALERTDDKALRLAGSLYPFWELRARHREARTWLVETLATGESASAELRAKALVAAGRATAWQFEWPTAISLLEEAVDISRELGDHEAVGRCLGFIGHGRLFTGHSDAAAEVLNSGVDLARSSGDYQGLARALYNAAFAPIERRDFERARAILEEAAEIARGEDMQLIEALCILHLGYNATLAGDSIFADDRLTEGGALLEGLGATMWVPVSRRYHALLLLLDGRVDEADAILRSLLSEGRDETPQFDLPNWVEELAAVASAHGDVQRAAVLWGATDAVFNARGLAVREENRQVRARFRNEPDVSSVLGWADARRQGVRMSLGQALEFAGTSEPAT
jgi:predicted ATPase/class 3 adenylate cyclase